MVPTRLHNWTYDTVVALCAAGQAESDRHDFKFNLAELQGVYSRAKLDVVFLSTDYQKKDWCGVEFRAVREIIFARENSRVMFVRN